MRLLAPALILCAVVAGCGPSSDAKTKEDIATMAKMLQSNGEPVKFEALQAFLPTDADITKNGWQKFEVTGMALAEPIKGAKAAMTLKKNDSELVVDIVDTVFNQSLFAPVAAFLADGFTDENANGFKRSIKFQDQPAFEEWTSRDRVANLTILVGKRYLVHLQATNVGSTEPVKSVAAWINLTKLADLK
ncbi:MAG: hypothetical protein KAY59_02165 [Acidobacteria bacterium]|jgi:hypothetical protein|nr:hypothetical protein [Acidobacteriota bacterium]